MSWSDTTRCGEGVSDSAIAVHGLSKRFGATQAVDNLSFEVAEGRIAGFLGPNGAGKTTTLRAMLGLVAPGAGSATFDGRAYRDLPDPVGTVGAVLEGSSFHPGRSGRDHLRVVARAGGLARERVEDCLGLVGLEDDAGRRVKGYSLGMRQRLGIAVALLGEPRFLLLDEPANGLDPQGIRWLRDFLRWQAGRGVTVLISSHVLAEVSQTVDDVVLLDGGRLVAQATMTELTARAEALVRVRTPHATELAGRLSARGADVEAAGEGRLVVRGASAESVGETAAEHRLVLHELVTDHSTLEDVFLRLTGTEELSAGPQGPSLPGLGGGR